MKIPTVNVMKGIALCALLLPCAVPSASAQTVSNVAISDFTTLLDQPIEIRTTGGGAFRGTLYAIRSDRLELLAPEGNFISIARDQVEMVIPLSAERGIRAFYVDPAANRLLIMPTAFPMDRGEIHVANQEIVSFSGSYGVTDRVSLWSGVSIPGALLSVRASSSAGDRLGASVGALAALPWMEVDDAALLPYALLSFGREDHNITVGAGVAFFADDLFGSTYAPVQVVGGKIPLSPRVAFVTETWLVQYVDANEWRLEALAPSIAFRILTEQLSWDLGALVPVFPDEETYQPLPWIAVSYSIR
jgi:hypothetical protein